MDAVFSSVIISLIAVATVIICIYLYKRKEKFISYVTVTVTAAVLICSVTFSDFKFGENNEKKVIGTVLFSISCREVRVEDKYDRTHVYGQNAVTLYEGDTVYDVLTRVSIENSIVIVNGGNATSAYIVSIGGITEEKHGGPKSGWMYFVNNVKIDVSSDKYVLSPNDIVVWYFDKDLKA